MNFRRGRNEFKTNDRRRGFTLLEMSVVLIIIALVTGMAISAGISTVASVRQAATINKMKAIDQALMAYRVANNRLPCPGDLTITPGSANFGVEAGGSSICTTGTGVCTGSTLWAPAFTGCVVSTALVPSANHSAAGATFTKETGAEGALPVITLGLPKDMMVDGWGNSFRYAVDTTMTEIGAFHDNPVDNTCGAITVNETNGSTRTKDAIYALISHGPNGHGAYTPYTGAGNPVTAGSTNANELINCHCTSAGAYNSAYAPTYVQALPSITTPGTATTTFDDIVTYKERWQMQTPWDPVMKFYFPDDFNNRVRKVQGCIITTVAGNGTGGYSGDGGAATSSELQSPAGVSLDSAGNIYIVDYSNERIRKVTAATGVITTVVGTGTYGYSGDGGPATTAKIGAPDGEIAVDSAGNIYIADTSNNRIRKVTASTGIITTVAGNGIGAYAGDGGQATSAELWFPTDVALDSAGNIYIVDGGNNRIRMVKVATGIITTIAGNGTAGYSGDNGAATSAKINIQPSIAVDSSGNLYIADYNNNRIRKVTAATGIITTVVGTGTYGYSGDGGPATTAKIGEPYGVALDTSGNIYIADAGNSRIRKVAASTGIISTIAGSGTSSYSGDGGPATTATINWPQRIAVSPSAAVANR